jgi:hypothetical protein
MLRNVKMSMVAKKMADFFMVLVNSGYAMAGTYLKDL